MRKKRVLALCLSAVMLAGALTGCGSSDAKEKDGGSKKEETTRTEDDDFRNGN